LRRGCIGVDYPENEFEWAVSDALTLSTNFAFLDPKLTQNYCGQVGVTHYPDQQTPSAFLGSSFTLCRRSIHSPTTKG